MYRLNIQAQPLFHEERPQVVDPKGDRVLDFQLGLQRELAVNKAELESKLKIKIVTLAHPLLSKCWIKKDSDWSIYQTINGRGIHRIVHKLCIGPIVKGNLVCHKCDRRGCFNPEHLFQGTQSDNMKDARNKGRIPLPSKRIGKKLRERDNWKRLVRFAGQKD